MAHQRVKEAKNDIEAKMREGQNEIQKGGSASENNKGMKFQLTQAFSCHIHGILLVCFFFAAVSCGDPGIPLNSQRSGQNFTFGRNLTFHCRDGFSLQGAASILCHADRSWSDLLPKCIPVQCRNLVPPPYGSLNTTNRTYSVTVRFACLLGFNLTGSRWVRCQSNALWTSPPPNCTPIQCSALAAPPFGRIVSQNNSFRGLLISECLSGFEEVSGHSERVCLASQRWQGTELYCKGKSFQLLC